MPTIVIGGAVTFDSGLFDDGTFDGSGASGPLAIVLSGSGVVVAGALYYLPPIPVPLITPDLFTGRVGTAHGDYALPTLTVTGPAQDARELVGTARGV